MDKKFSTQIGTLERQFMKSQTIHYKTVLVLFCNVVFNLSGKKCFASRLSKLSSFGKLTLAEVYPQ